MLQKIINGIAFASGVVSITVVGAVGIVYLNKDAIDGDDELTIRTELKGGMGKYGRLLGWLYIGDDEVSLNEKMIVQGYAWSYDGGTKQKNFEELREIRRSFGTLQEG